jgi:hypothetical protein
MADQLGDMQSVVAGAVTSLVTRLKTIATEIENVAATDSIEYKTDLLREAADITALLDKWGVNPADVLSPEVADAPYERFIRGIV